MNLNELNPAQRDAVLYCDGPSLVIAGAGSGKTRVLTYKIAYLLEQGMEPWSIMALTFTNKAAGEMKERIARQVGEERASRLWMGTFHSIFARILRFECHEIGFDSNFTIYDAADSKNMVKGIIKEMHLDDKVYKASTVLNHISAAKNRLVLPDAYMNDPQLFKADQSSRIPATGQIYKTYWTRCRQANAMDFDDILLYTFLLFHNKPEVRERYEQRFQFVLVDEYQDTNYAQHAIVWQLTEHHRHVCVVGDDAQSIYSFRGANIDNILTFQKLYQGARLFKLEQNYRSTQIIVNAANSLIRHNRGQIHKEVFSRKEKGQPIHIYQFYSDLEEANGVARKLMNLNRYDHVVWSHIAILYRTNAQSRTFEEAFRKNDIPYRIYGGVSFYQRKEVKDMIAWFRLAVNPNDEEALKRAIKYPSRGIGDTTMQKLQQAATQQNVNLWLVLNNPMAHGVDVNRGTMARIATFVQLINSFREHVNDWDAAMLGKRIAQESGVVADVFKGRETEDITRQENLQELLDGMQQFVDERREETGENQLSLSHYLQEVSLISTLDESDDDSTEKVSLMTVHSAKGLEFDIVFVTGMEEDLFPNQMSNSSVRELEEERRLFYVAITRAADQCYLTYARNRYRNGRPEFCEPSRFLNDIDEQYVEFHETAGTSRPQPRIRPSFFDSDPDFARPAMASRKLFSSTVTPTKVEPPRPQTGQWRKVTPIGTTPSLGNASSQPSASSSVSIPKLSIGTRIEHSRFGVGEVIAMSGAGIDAKATIRFQNVGEKQLLLRFAKFTILP